jgi:hypothetical protein
MTPNSNFSAPNLHSNNAGITVLRVLVLPVCDWRVRGTCQTKLEAS